MESSPKKIMPSPTKAIASAKPSPAKAAATSSAKPSPVKPSPERKRARSPGVRVPGTDTLCLAHPYRCTVVTPKPPPLRQFENKNKSLVERLQAEQAVRIGNANKASGGDGERRAAKKSLVEEDGERRAVVTTEVVDIDHDAAIKAKANEAVSPFLSLLNNPDFLSKIDISPDLTMLLGAVKGGSTKTFKISTYKKIISEINKTMSSFCDDDVSTPSIFMGTLRGRAEAAMEGLVGIKMKVDTENIKAARAQINEEYEAKVKRAKKAYTASVKALQSNRDKEIAEVVGEMEQKFLKRYPVSPWGLGVSLGVVQCSGGRVFIHLGSCSYRALPLPCCSPLPSTMASPACPTTSTSSPA